MANEAEELLSAEQAVQQLLKELTELKKQVGGYDQARLSLEEVRNTLNTMVERTQALSEKTHQVVSMLGNLGTPEIISRVDSVRAALRDLGSRNDETHKVQAATTEQQANRVYRAAFTCAVLAGMTLVVAILILVKLMLK